MRRRGGASAAIAKARDVIPLICPRCGVAILLPLKASAGVTCPSCRTEFEAADGVLLLGDELDDNEFDPSFYDVLSEVESDHPWFRVRRRLIRSALIEALGPLVDRAILDVGCGTGTVLSMVEREGATTCGIDVHLAGLRQARSRCAGALLRCDPGHVPFRGSFDAALLCDVIEHVDDDRAILAHTAEAVTDDGAVVITVPADPRLWSNVDEAIGHRRRYSRRSLAAAIEGAGMRARSVRYVHGLLWPAALLRAKRLLSTELGGDHVRTAEVALAVPTGPARLAAEAAFGVSALLTPLALPFGTSLIAIAERTSRRPAAYISRP